MIGGNWPAPRHSWKRDEIEFAARCWSVGMTQTETAAALTARYGFPVTRNSIGTLTRVHPELFARRVMARAA